VILLKSTISETWRTPKLHASQCGVHGWQAVCNFRVGIISGTERLRLVPDFTRIR